VIRRLSAVRTGHISHLTYFWPLWRTFWEHDFPRLRVVADGQEIFHDQGLAFVGNISRYSVGLRICRDARFDDGLLDLVVFSCREQGSLMLHAAWTLLRLHPLKGNVLYRRVKAVKIESDRPAPCQIDGDLGRRCRWTSRWPRRRSNCWSPAPDGMEALPCKRIETPDLELQSIAGQSFHPVWRGGTSSFDLRRGHRDVQRQRRPQVAVNLARRGAIRLDLHGLHPPIKHVALEWVQPQ